MVVVNTFESKQEWLQFWRNSDILTIAVRGVTTASDTGTFSADTSHLIDHTNTKNVRSVVVSAVTLDYGADYTIDFTFDDSGTFKAKISFTVAQTGDFTITYDFGTDKIFGDWPRDDLSIDSFPRLSAELRQDTRELAGYGGTNKTAEQVTLTFSLTIFSADLKQIDQLVNTAKTKIKANITFNFFQHVIRSSVSPLLSPNDAQKQEIFNRTIEFESLLNIEK